MVASGNICVNARYNAIKTVPWASANKKMARVTVAEGASRLENVNLDYWFYGLTALASVTVMANLRELRV